MLTPERLYRNAKNFARKRLGDHENTDDFAAWAVERFIASDGRRRRLEWLWVDWVRENWGNRRNGREFGTRQRLRTALPIDDFHELEAPSFDPGDWIDFERHLKKVSAYERCILVLSCMWGFTARQIAYVMGVSESRICQRMTQAHRVLRKRLGGKGNE